MCTKFEIWGQSILEVIQAFHTVHLTKGHNYWTHGAIWTITELEEDIMVLNNVTKFHKILIKTIWLSWTCDL